MVLVIIFDISPAIIICEAVPDKYKHNYFLLVLTKPLAYIVSSFFLFSRDKPPASSLILALGLTLGVGLGLITTKGLYFLTSIFLYIEISLLNTFKTNSYCVGGRHYSATINKRGVVSAKGTKMLRGNCVKCRRNKSMTVSDATIEPEGLKDFFKSVGKDTVNFGKKVANNPVRAFEIASKIGSAAASRNPRAALSTTPDLIKFATTGEGINVVQRGRGLYLGTKKR